MVSIQASSNFALGNRVFVSRILRYPSPSKKWGIPRAGMYIMTVEKKTWKLSHRIASTVTFSSPSPAKMHRWCRRIHSYGVWPIGVCFIKMRYDSTKSPINSSTHFIFPSGRRRFGSTRCVLIQGGASPTRTVLPSPRDLVSSPSFLHWPTPSCCSMSTHVAGALGPVFSSETSSIGLNTARFKPNPVMDHS